jgi:hypothetical protein
MAKIHRYPQLRSQTAKDIGYKNNKMSNKIQTWQIRKINIILGYSAILNPGLDDISNIFLVCSIPDNYTGFNHNLSR